MLKLHIIGVTITSKYPKQVEACWHWKWRAKFMPHELGPPLEWGSSDTIEDGGHCLLWVLDKRQGVAIIIVESMVALVFLAVLCQALDQPALCEIMAVNVVDLAPLIILLLA